VYVEERRGYILEEKSMELAIVLMILLIVVAVGAIKLNENNLAFPFKKKTNLFTPTERTFLQLIEAAVGNQYKVICRVKVADILAVRQGTDKRTSRSALMRASGKQLDFVLCSKEDMSPVVAIDLVHKSGKDGYKTQRDWFISGSLDAARIPHVRIKVKSGYRPHDIRECINAKLAPMLYKEPKDPIIKGTQGKAEKPSLINPVAA
jgi:hypothetical protein